MMLFKAASFYQKRFTCSNGSKTVPKEATDEERIVEICCFSLELCTPLFCRELPEIDWELFSKTSRTLETL